MAQPGLLLPPPTRFSQGGELARGDLRGADLCRSEPGAKSLLEAGLPGLLGSCGTAPARGSTSPAEHGGEYGACGNSELSGCCFLSTWTLRGTTELPQAAGSPYTRGPPHIFLLLWDSGFL